MTRKRTTKSATVTTNNWESGRESNDEEDSFICGDSEKGSVECSEEEDAFVEEEEEDDDSSVESCGNLDNSGYVDHDDSDDDGGRLNTKPMIVLKSQITGRLIAKQPSSLNRWGGGRASPRPECMLSKFSDMGDEFHNPMKDDK